MDNILAYKKALESQGIPMKYFDWNKAALIIKEYNAESAIAGLSRDLEYTSGYIYMDGKPYFEDYTYLGSTWAIPVLILDHDYDNEIECYIIPDDAELEQYNAKNKWSKSSIQLLGLNPDDYSKYLN